MNVKKYWIAVVASYLIMGVIATGGTTLLAQQLSSFTAIGRMGADLEANFMWGLIGYVVITIFFCYIYVKGREAGDLMEGLKFGVMFGLMMSGMSLVSFAMLPIDMTAAITDIAINILVYAGGGVTVAMIYKPT